MYFKALYIAVIFLYTLRKNTEKPNFTLKKISIFFYVGFQINNNNFYYRLA